MRKIETIDMKWERKGGYWWSQPYQTRVVLQEGGRWRVFYHGTNVIVGGVYDLDVAKQLAELFVLDALNQPKKAA